MQKKKYKEASLPQIYGREVQLKREKQSKQEGRWRIQRRVAGETQLLMYWEALCRDVLCEFRGRGGVVFIHTKREATELFVNSLAIWQTYIILYYMVLLLYTGLYTNGLVDLVHPLD